MKSELSDRLIVIFSYSFIVLFAMLCLFPLLMALSVSFSSEQAIGMNGFSILPQMPTLYTYQYLFSEQLDMLLNAYMVTIFVSVAGTLLAMIVTIGFAYTASLKNFRFGNTLSFIAYFTMLFTGGLLPWYLVCTRYYHLTNTIAALILPYSMNVFFMYLLRNYFRSIPTELFEAAKIDGAGHFTTLVRIMLPFSKIGLVTVAMFYMLGYWNDWYLALMFITKNNLNPVQYMLYCMLANTQYLSQNSNSGLTQHVAVPLQTTKMALTCVTIGPIILIFPFVQKYFVRGIITGAIKA